MHWALMFRITSGIAAAGLFLSACQGTTYTRPAEGDAYVGPEEQGAKSIADWNAQLGAGYIQNGQYDRAMLKLKKALDDEPNHPQANNYIAVLYWRLKQNDLARKHFAKALSGDPRDSSIRNNYAAFLCDEGRFEDAQKEYNVVLRNPLYSQRELAFEGAATCAAKVPDYAMADKYYREALEINSDLPGSLLGMAMVAYKQGDYDYAWNYFKRFEKVSSHTSDSLWLGINILRKMDVSDSDKRHSLELQLKNLHPDSEQAKWLFQGKQEY